MTDGRTKPKLSRYRRDVQRSYLARGRRYKGLSDGDLVKRWRNGLIQAARETGFRHHPDLNDVLAEVELRGIDREGPVDPELLNILQAEADDLADALRRGADVLRWRHSGNSRLH